MSDITQRLRASLAFDGANFPSHWNGHDRTCALAEHARLQPILEQLVLCVEAAQNVRCSRYPERAHTPELEASLTALEKLLEET